MIKNRLLFLLSLTLVMATYSPGKAKSFKKSFQQDTTRIDREYALEATMLGYFGPDGARNPTLKAHKGERVRIKITNGELMTHDISLEKLGLKSKVILEK